VAQRDYALAMAWRRYVGVGQAPGGPFSFVFDEHGPADPSRYCHLRVIADPMPTYPNTANWGEHTGFVILRVLLDADGRAADIHVAAALPQAWFQEAVERVASHWRVEIADDADPGCTMPQMMFPTVNFVLGR
jgi:TonB family protein